MTAQLSFGLEAFEFERVCQHWASNHPKYLASLRELGIAIARRLGEVTVDELREEMAKFKIPFPKEIGADERMIASVLRGCRQLQIKGERKTTRVDWAKRVGSTRDKVTVYELKVTHE